MHLFPKRANRLPPAIFFLIALVAVANFVWLWSDQRPFAWDESIHYLGAIGYHETLHQAKPDTFIKLLYQSDFYPPWHELLTGTIFLLGHPSPKTAAFINVAYLAGIIFLLCLLGRKMFDVHAGVLAGFVFAASSMVVIQSEYFMLDIPLAFFVCLGLYGFVRSESFTSRQWSLVYGLAFGLALLTKWSAVIFLLVPPLAVGLRSVWRQEAKAGRIWVNIILTFALAGVLAAPWYAVHLPQFLRHAPAYVYQRGVLENDPPLLSLGSWFFYPAALFTQMSWPLALLALLGVVIFLLNSRNGWLAGLWLGLPYLFLTLIRNKDMRYTLPWLPLVSLLAVGWTSKLAEPSRKLWHGVIMAFALGQLIYVHAGVYAGPLYRWLSTTIWGVPMIDSRAPDPRPWPLDRILRDVESLAPEYQRPVCLRVVPDHASFNRVAFLVAQTQAPRGRILISGNTDWPAFTDFAITKTGDLGLPFTIEHPLAITRELARWEKQEQAPFRLVKRYALPDGSEALLYLRAPVDRQSSSTEILEALQQHFSQLLSRYVRDGQNLKLDIIPLSPGLTMEGRFKSLRIRVQSGRIGDFAHNPLGVPVRNLDLELLGIDLDLAAAMENKILPYRLETIRVNCLELHADDINRALAGGNAEERKARVSFEPGVIRCTWAGRPPVTASLGLKVKPDPQSKDSDNLRFNLRRLSLYGISLPGWLFQPVLEDFNPLLKLAGFPGRVVLGKLILLPGTLKLVLENP